MYAFIAGILKEKNPDNLIIENNNIGYSIDIPLSTYTKLPEVNKTISLYTHLYVREDVMRLYGFLSLEEKNLFLTLQKTNGVGAKLAITVISHISVKKFMYAIVNNEINTITKIPGVGKKTAERIVLDLKDRMELFTSLDYTSTSDIPNKTDDTNKQIFETATNALISLGYTPSQAKKSIYKIEQSYNQINNLPLEQIITLALKDNNQ